MRRIRWLEFNSGKEGEAEQSEGQVQSLQRLLATYQVRSSLVMMSRGFHLSRTMCCVDEFSTLKIIIPSHPKNSIVDDLTICFVKLDPPVHSKSSWAHGLRSGLGIQFKRLRHPFHLSSCHLFDPFSANIPQPSTWRRQVTCWSPRPSG